MTQTKPAVTASSTGKWKAYPAYKDSGVEWLREIPVHWDVRRLKYLTKDMIAGPFGSSLTKDLYTTEGYRVYGQEQVIPADFSIGDYYIPEDLFLTMTRYAINAGDVLVSCVGTFGKVAVVPLEVEPGIINPRLVKLVPNKDVILPAYLGLLLRSQVAFEQIEQVSRGGTMGVINLGLLSDLLLSLPSLDEQRTIATYLDCETARIDALIAKKERLVELLQEKRAALISHAVTKGLDPTVPMKDSGVEWLGEIPAHWDVRRIAMAAQKITNGYVGPTRDIFVDEGVRYLQSLHIKNGEIQFNKPYYVTQEWSNDHAKSILCEGDVLVVQTGDIGQCCAVSRAFAGCNCHALIIIQLKDKLGSGFYLSAFLRSDYGWNMLLYFQTGALHPHLECGNVREIRILLPPPEEQSQIMNYLDYETAKIDILISRIRDGIEKLKEYSTALISAAVTGKIDVRETISDHSEEL